MNAGLDALALDKAKLRSCRNDIGQMGQQLAAQKARATDKPKGTGEQGESGR